jgi:hypothetical protein
MPQDQWRRSNNRARFGPTYYRRDSSFSYVGERLKSDKPPFHSKKRNDHGCYLFEFSDFLIRVKHEFVSHSPVPSWFGGL